MRSSNLGDAWSGLWLPLAGARLLGRGRRLVLLALVPCLVTALAALAAGWGVAQAGDALLSWAWARPVAAADAGLLRGLWSHLALWAWQGAWWVAALSAVALAALAAARVITAPAMDFLSEHAMEHLGVEAPAGVVAHGKLPLGRQILVSMVRALGRTLLLAAGWAAVALLTLVPGGAVVATPLGMLWTAAWLFTDTVLYALQWTGPATLADVRALVAARPGLSFGFALGTSLLMLVPFAGLLVTPAAVAGGCLLVARVQRQPQGAGLVAAFE